MNTIEQIGHGEVDRTHVLSGLIDRTLPVDISTPETIMADTTIALKAIHKYAKRHGIRPPERVVEELDEIDQDAIRDLVENVDWNLPGVDEINPKYPKRSDRLKNFMDKEIPVGE